MLKNAFFNQFQSLIKTKPLKIFENFQNRQLNCTLDFISILHGNVLHTIQRPGEGRTSDWICGQVVEFMSVYGNSKPIKSGGNFKMFLINLGSCCNKSCFFSHTECFLQHFGEQTLWSNFWSVLKNCILFFQYQIVDLMKYLPVM